MQQDFTIRSFPEEQEMETGREENTVLTPSANIIQIYERLETMMHEQQTFLNHDLLLYDVAKQLGTNRTYLGAYFAARGETYNTYINRLRIDHFIGLYQEAAARGRNVTAQQLSAQSGYRNYTTFSNAFKQRTGQNVTQWIKNNT
jgi:YesN/AraC family two-component response regulator